MSTRITIVLTEPENPDNVGAVARAMKNTGLKALRLVSPPKDWKRIGRKMAVSAADLLYEATTYKSLKSALKDMHLAIGVTRRTGYRRGHFVSFEEGLKKIETLPTAKRVALVFGKESKGLSNEDLAFCDTLMALPTHASYPSMNLAQAVMAVSFSLFARKKGKATACENRELRLVEKNEIEVVLRRFRVALDHLGYAREGVGIEDRILATFHGLIKRNGLIHSEAQMFKGFIRRIEEKLPKPGKGD